MVNKGATFISAFVSTGGYHMLIERYFNATADLTKRAFKVPGDPESGLCGDVDPGALIESKMENLNA